MALTEGQHTGEFILSEANGWRSRETVTVTVPASTTLEPGYVLSQLTADGKYVPHDNAGTDGTESAAAILYGELVNAEETAADMTGVAIVRDAEVRKADLLWSTGLVDADKTAAYSDLASVHIIARD